MMPRTRRGRWLTTAVSASIVAATISSWYFRPDLPPDSLMWGTAAISNRAEIVSTIGRADRTTCGHARFFYRGAVLCNTNQLDAVDFDVAQEQFRAAVDKAWRGFYASILETAIISFALALVASFIIAACAGVILWCLRGAPAK